LKKEKELKDIEEEHAKAESEFKEQQRKRRGRGTDSITLQGRRRRGFLWLRKWRRSCLES